VRVHFCSKVPYYRTVLRGGRGKGKEKGEREGERKEERIAALPIGESGSASVLSK